MRREKPDMSKKYLNDIQYYESIGQVLLSLPGTTPLSHLKALGLHYEAADEDEFLCLHYETFGRQWPPYHAVFWSLEEEKEMFRSHLFSFLEGEDEFKKRVEFNKESPDHIGIHFLFLSHLLKREFERKCAKTKAKRKYFVKSYLFPFSIMLLLTLEREAATPFKELARDLFKRFVEDFKETLGEGLSCREEIEAEIKLRREELFPLLNNKESGLKEISSYLLNPSKIGFFLGQKSLLNCARSCELPFGFGKRTELLLQLFYTSLDFEKLGPLIESLKEEVQKWVHFYKEKKKELDGLAFYWEGLIARSNMAIELLTEMKSISEKEESRSLGGRQT